MGGRRYFSTIGFHIEICFHGIHKAFIPTGRDEKDPVLVKSIDPVKPAVRIIKSALMSLNMNPNDSDHYQLGTCNCGGTGQVGEEKVINSDLAVNKQGWKEGQRLFLRKIKDDVPEAESSLKHGREESSSSLSSTPKPPFKKKKLKRELPPVEWETLTGKSAEARDKISELVGGVGWMKQRIGRLNCISSRNANSLNSLRQTVEMSSRDFSSDDDDSTRKGFFSPDLIIGLIRAFDHRQRKEMAAGGGAHFTLGTADYIKATQMIREKIRNNGEWPAEEGISDDLSTVVAPQDQYPLTELGLTGKLLLGSRSICMLWKNDKWLRTPPAPGLKPISLRSSDTLVPLRQIAILTPVEGDPPENGFPEIVLKVLRQAIEYGKANPLSRQGGTSPMGWSMNRALPYAYLLLKKELGVVDPPPLESSCVASGSGSGSGASGSGSTASSGPTAVAPLPEIEEENDGDKNDNDKIEVEGKEEVENEEEEEENGIDSIAEAQETSIPEAEAETGENVAKNKGKAVEEKSLEKRGSRLKSRDLPKD